MTHANEIKTEKHVENCREILYSKMYFPTYENMSIYWAVNNLE